MMRIGINDRNNRTTCIITYHYKIRGRLSTRTLRRNRMNVQFTKVKMSMLRTRLFLMITCRNISTYLYRACFKAQITYRIRRILLRLTLFARRTLRRGIIVQPFRLMKNNRQKRNNIRTRYLNEIGNRMCGLITCTRAMRVRTLKLKRSRTRNTITLRFN